MQNTIQLIYVPFQVPKIYSNLSGQSYTISRRSWFSPFCFHAPTVPFLHHVRLNWQRPDEIRIINICINPVLNYMINFCGGAMNFYWDKIFEYPIHEKSIYLKFKRTQISNRCPHCVVPHFQSKMHEEDNGIRTVVVLGPGLIRRFIGYPI